MLIPEKLLRYSVVGDSVEPHFLGKNDYGWLRLLLDEYRALIGKSRREFKACLMADLPFSYPQGKKRLVVYYLLQMSRSKPKTQISPKKLRAIIFPKAVSNAPREVVLSEVAASLSISVSSIENLLFADLANEQKIEYVSEDLGLDALATAINSALIQSILFRSASLELSISGGSKDVVRYAKLKGLLCTVSTQDTSSKTTISISGPYSLFKRTLLYGKSFSDLLPTLIWCNDFSLRSEVILNEQRLYLHLKSGDPILPTRKNETPKIYDSKLEEQFAKDFKRALPEWDLIREPSPFKAGETLIFPDFCLRDRLHPNREWILEIVGFWTPEYLIKKIDRLKAANISNLVLCIDETLNCSLDEQIISSSRVVYFKRKIDVAAVAAILTASL